jgi:hypothetical protein
MPHDDRTDPLSHTLPWCLEEALTEAHWRRAARGARSRARRRRQIACAANEAKRPNPGARG